MAKNLTGKQEAFSVLYIKTGFNGYQAAKEAGYKGNYGTLCAVAYENLRKPHIRKRISELMIQIFEITEKDVVAHLTAQIFGEIPTRIIDGPKGKTKIFDTIKALELLGKHFAMFTERLEVGGELEVKGYVRFDPSNWPHTTED